MTHDDMFFSFMFGAPILKPYFDLCLREVEIPSQLFSFTAYHVTVFFEYFLKSQQLTWRECCPNAFWLSKHIREMICGCSRRVIHRRWPVGVASSGHRRISNGISGTSASYKSIRLVRLHQKIIIIICNGTLISIA